jgi:hypothetical protein
MKDLEFSGDILSGTECRISHDAVSLANETNNMARQAGRSPADSWPWPWIKRDRSGCDDSLFIKPNRAICNMLIAIKFTVTLLLLFAIDLCGAAFVQYAG